MTNTKLFDFYTSDLHFGHRNIIDHCNRPFSSAEEMDDFMADTWNSQVLSDSRICVVGDLTLCSTPRALDYIKRLRGAITLVSGNHDATFKKDSAVERYLAAGLVEVVDVLEFEDHRVSHFPFKNDPQERYHSRRLVDDGKFLIHGHVHDCWRQRGRMINVGIDAWGGRLVSAEEIVFEERDQEIIEWT